MALSIGAVLTLYDADRCPYCARVRIVLIAIGKKLVLIPGKHTVRVKTFDGSLGVHNSAQQTITLVSNVITIETTAASRPVAR